MPSHHDTIVDQFTKQAVPFSTAPAIRDEEMLALLVEHAGAGPEDEVLDVACGPGLVVCAFARVVRHATGIDLTPAMIERARALQAEQGLANVSWRVGDVLPLPWPDGAFTIVSTRFAFHHFTEPLAVLREMRRVCRPGGRVVVVDLTASDDPAKADAFNRMERIRDPSHVRALPITELQSLFPAAGLPAPAVRLARLPVEVEGMLTRSFPATSADVDRIRGLFAASVADDAFGLGTTRKGDELRFAYPVAFLVAERPA